MRQLSVPGSLSRQEVDRLLRGWLKVGDEIPLDTTHSGVIIGFGEKYINRGGLGYKYAGTYIDFQKLLIVRNDTEEREFVVRGGSGSANAWIRIGDLPETPFWEGDEVCYDDQHPHGHYSWTVDQVTYVQGVTMCYFLEGVDRDGFSKTKSHSVISDEPLTLVKRGDLWKFAHDEPLVFTNIEDEAAFYRSLGLSQKLSFAPESGLRGEISWDMGAAVRAIRNGTADEMKIKDKHHITFVLIKYDNEEFGVRMRAHTLAKFGLIED